MDSSGADAADDDKHGTQDSPFLSIRRALDAAVRDKDAGVGAKIIIGPGTYREPIDIPAPTRVDTDAPLVIEAAERDQTIIDCADTAGWEPATWKAEGKVWMHPYPAARGAALNVPADREPLIFSLDGVVLRQVETAGALVPGTVCIVPGDRKNPATVRVVPPQDAEVTADSVFQVAARDHGLAVARRRGVVVRGLFFQHAAGLHAKERNAAEPVSAGVVLRGCSDVLLEDILSQWNEGAGVAIIGADARPWSAGFTLRRVRAIHNGQSGLAVDNVKDLLAEDCETSFNGFRGEWNASADPQGPAGAKARGLHGSTWRRQRAVSNFCRGLWWNGDCTDLLVEDAVVRDNLFSGLLIENCPGPSVVRGCFVAGNKPPPSGKPEAGQPAAVSLEASPDVTLENNVVAGNPVPQLGLREPAERTDGTDFETGAKTPLRAERHVYHHNAFCGADANQILCDLPAPERGGKNDFAPYYGTLDTDENCFWNPASEAVFTTYAHNGARTRITGLAAWRATLAGFAGAKDAARPEAGSLWQDPLFMEPAEGDYRLQAQSPLIDWGLPSDEGAVAQ
ncbi:MAG: right-handed parallel beta-helix repeat-containing protein [Gluconacetobacter diazotrophicus]|nr:right-handed parallel beta-helix repeat-containing protein [Gluconacetobacter diazotrophicus]